MRNSLKALACAVSVFLGSSFPCHRAFADGDRERGDGVQAVRTAKVPGTFTFAGQKISLRRQDMYERMDREIIAFTFMHSTSILMLKRSGIYFPVVEPILKEEGLPDDLKYIMVIESSLDPNARSAAGAAGLWQLMTATAREQKLEVNANIDERYHVEKATRAACRILKESYGLYGDWLTVAAAYNAGRNGINRRLESQRQTKAEDLWLAEETSRYMFRLLAAKMMFENPGDFGFDVPDSEKYRRKAPREKVKVTSTVTDLADFAERHGVSYAQLKRANPWLREDSLQDASGRTYYVDIPAE